MQLVVDFSKFLGITRTRLVEDSLVMAATVHNLAAHAHNEMIGELVRRYGADAPITITVGPGPDGGGEETVLIDGIPPDDITSALVIEEQTGSASVFMDLVDFDRPGVGTVRLGPHVLVTRPMMRTARLPWPPDETLGLVARLGEMVGEEQAGKLVKLPAVEQAAT